MIRYTQGNLLDADVEALVNTVNTVGVMGKGIALMFKEMFPENFKRYAAACKAGEVEIGHVFVTERNGLLGPKWIINFPTKEHWRHPSKMEWIVAGLNDLHQFLLDKGIKSIAIPRLGSGNGRLEWSEVREHIEAALCDLGDVEVVVYEPTRQYQNVAKNTGLKKLTPARALIAELVRRYWVMGFECTLLEIQKLAWFLERAIEKTAPENPLDLRFSANKYGPYANRLDHLLNGLDGSYLHCEKRIADAGPLDVIWFDEGKKRYLQTYLKSASAKPYWQALESTSALIDGFESPLGMELLASVDWVLTRMDATPDVASVRSMLERWPGERFAGERKLRLFDERLLELAVERLAQADTMPEFYAPEGEGRREGC